MSEQYPWYTALPDQAIERVLMWCGINSNNPPTECRILDFGCGNGRYLGAFRTVIAPQNLFGVEVHTESLLETRLQGFNCVQIGTNENVLPFKSNYFQIVFSSNVIEHIPRSLYLQYLQEIRRVLVPGGRFVVGTPNYPIKRVYDVLKAIRTEHKRYYLFDDPTHCNKLSIFQLERDLAEVFREVNLEPTKIFFDRSLSILQRPDIRYRLRWLGDKIMGYCIK